MAQKRIMVLGAGRGQVDLIKAIRKYGHTAIVASIDGNYPGFALANEICYVNIADPVAVCEKAKALNIDAVTTACLDTGIAALGYTCEKLGLCGLSEKAAKLSQNKLLMKQAFMDHNVSTARFKKVTNPAELAEAEAALNYPLIVKAIDLQGSRGINIARSHDELLAGYQNTMAETQKDFCIVEEFIEGYEFGAQAFVVNGEVLYVLPCGDITYLSKTNIPVGHYAPLDVTQDIWNCICEQSVKAIHALGLDNCAVNIDMILKDEEVYLIELTGRVGANCLPQLSSIYYGIDVYRLIIDTALGLNPKNYFLHNKKAPTPCYAKMLYSEKGGLLKEIINENASNDRIEEVSFFVTPGDEIRPFTNSRDCVGEIVVKGTSVDDCRDALEKAVANIHFVME